MARRTGCLHKKSAGALKSFPAELLTRLLLVQDLMVRVGTLDDTVRWARIMSELTEVAGKLCVQTAKAIYIEITQRLVVCSYWTFD